MYRKVKYISSGYILVVTLYKYNYVYYEFIMYIMNYEYMNFFIPFYVF